jgi:hypothetical protein
MFLFERLIGCRDAKTRRCWCLFVSSVSTKHTLMVPVFAAAAVGTTQMLMVQVFAGRCRRHDANADGASICGSLPSGRIEPRGRSAPNEIEWGSVGGAGSLAVARRPRA